VVNLFLLTQIRELLLEGIDEDLRVLSLSSRGTAKSGSGWQEGRTLSVIQDVEKRYVHMLNGTLCERTLCGMLENYQNETRLRVPEVLQQFIGTGFLPYKEEDKPNEKKKEEKNKEPKPKKEKVEAKQEKA
jgi:hypothetical protein